MLHLESHEDFKNTDIWEPHTHLEILVDLVWGASKTFGFERRSWLIPASSTFWEPVDKINNTSHQVDLFLTVERITAQFMTSGQNGEKTAGLGREEKGFSSASKTILHGRVLEVLGQWTRKHTPSSHDPRKRRQVPTLACGQNKFCILKSS